MVLLHEEQQSKGGTKSLHSSRNITGGEKPPKKMRKQTKLIKGNTVGERRTNLWQEMTISARGQWVKTWRFNQKPQGRRNSISASPTIEEAEENALFHRNIVKKQQSQSQSDKHKTDVLNHSVDDEDEQSNQSSMKIFESDFSEESETGWSEWEDQTASESSEEDIDGLFATYDNMIQKQQQQQQQGSSRSIPTTIQMEKQEQDDNERLMSSADEKSTLRILDEAAKEETWQHYSRTQEPRENEASDNFISELTSTQKQRKRRTTGVPTDSTKDLAGAHDIVHGSIGSEVKSVSSPLRKKKKSLQLLPTMQSIHWDEDPMKSQADWRVEIYHEVGRGEGGTSSGVADLYNIHKNIVSVGTRRSRWFERELRRRRSGQHLLDNKNSCNISRLSLSKEQAKMFPAILDFMYYGTEANIAFTVEQACAAFKVAEMFEVRAMKKAILRFYQKNISFKNMGKFLNCATKYNADDLVDVTKVGIGKLILDQPKKASFLNPKFLADIICLTQQHHRQQQKTNEEVLRDSEVVLCDDGPTAQTQSRKFSIAAYVCMSHHENNTTNNLPGEIFGFLFSAEILPFIDASVAVDIIVMEGRRRIKEQPMSEHTINLQRRCIKGIVHGWDTFEKGYSSPEAASLALQDLPSTVLAEILIYKLKRK